MFGLFMRRFALVVTVMMAGSAHADEAAGPAIEHTIQSQIDAFRVDDFENAFTYASPYIQGIFGTYQNFGMMVQRGYPMVHRPSDIRFLDLREENGRVLQKVRVRDASGATYLLDYEMIQSENGWKINGVQVLNGQGLAA